MAENSSLVDLDAIIDTVCDERSFIAFLEALANDFAMDQQLEVTSPYGPGPLGWENGSVDTVLQAAAAWGHATLLTGTPPPPSNPWQRCALIIYAGKFYE